MKPSFALDFRDGLVTLLHRTSRGWSQVGSTAMDAPDLAEALGYLRATALGLSPRGITTKLVIPNEQILYTQVHAPAPEPAKRRRQIKAALEGLTPYAIDDLVYDWTGTGAHLQVAVIPRATLAEAEAFATEHRFNPVSFVAVPDNGTFLSEPFFGQSDLAATLLAQGEKVERDTDPVTVVARDFPKAAPAPVAAPTPVTAPSVAEIVAAKPPPIEDFWPETTSTTPFVPLPVPPLRAESAMPPAARRASEPPKPPIAPPEPALRTPSLPEVMPQKPAPEIIPTAPKPESVVPEAPMAIDVALDLPLEMAPTAGDVADLDDVPPSPAAEIVAAFASRRNAAIAAATAGSLKASGATGKIPSVGPAPGIAAATSPASSIGGQALGQRPTIARPNLARPSASATPLPFPQRGQPAAKPAPTKSGKGNGSAVTVPGITGPRRDRNVVPLLPTATPIEGQDAARRAAASKPALGLGKSAAPIKGRPRYLGLILTGILLVLLAAVAAWSSFFMGTNDSTGTGTTPATTQSSLSTAPSDTTAAVTITEPAPAATKTTAPAAETPAAMASEPASQTTVVDPTPSAPDTTAASTAAAAQTAADQTAALQAAAEQATAAQSAEAPTASVPATTAAAPVPTAPEPAPKTEVSTVAVPLTAAPSAQPTGTQDQIVLANADQPPTLSVPLALPTVAAGADVGPAAVPSPPPYGTVYKFDADGHIIPTPEGIVTPEGVLLIAGKPKLTPPDRPAELTIVPAAPVASDSTTSAAISIAVEAAAAPSAAQSPATVAAAPVADATAVQTATPSTDASASTATSTSASPALTATATTAQPAPAADATATATAAPNASTATAPTATDPTAAAVPAALPQDPSLKGKHPRNRPADLTSPAAQQGLATSEAAVDGRLAGLHPQTRPADLPAPASPLAANTSADAGAVSASLASSGMALMTSPIPAKRPSGLDRAVDTAVVAALNQPAQKQPAQKQPTQKQAAAKVAPDVQVASDPAPAAQEEPDLVSPAPILPTNASVARQATTKNAINTRRVALLAVFGTSSTRFAMIRQSNGAVKKVQVGDAMEGGQIAAITATSVQYQKGGQMVTLSLPTG